MAGCQTICLPSQIDDSVLWTAAKWINRAQLECRVDAHRFIAIESVLSQQVGSPRIWEDAEQVVFMAKEWTIVRRDTQQTGGLE